MSDPTVTNAPIPPTSPADGDLWFNTITGRTYVWYISPITSVGQWVQTQPSAAAVVPDVSRLVPPPPAPGPSPFDVTRTPMITLAAVPPPGPTPGDLWWDTISGREFVFYADATGT